VHAQQHTVSGLCCVIYDKYHYDSWLVHHALIAPLSFSTSAVTVCMAQGMMPGIQDMLKRVAESKGESWDVKLAQLKKNGQWHVEVY
jgi:hypothetical protein